MKKLSLLFISAIAAVNLMAQQFETSTAASPQWYIIQVKGSGDRAGLVVTEIDGQVSGRPLASGVSAKSRQMWRFEAMPENSRYEIVNRYSGRKLDVYYDAARGERIAKTSETPSTVWRIEATGIDANYYLRLVTQPEGGISGAGYLTQGGEELNSALYFTKLGADKDNLLFQFISMNLPVTSTENETVWFSIRSAQSALAGKLLTEIESTGNVQLALNESADGDLRQHWKIVANSASEGTVNFVNRATGNLISSVPVFDIYYYMQHAGTETAGWQMDSLGNNQYAIHTGAAGLERYWNAATAGQVPASYRKEAVLHSGFAWRFQFVDSDTPAAIVLPEYGNWRVRAENRRIHVEGADSYRIYTIQGIRVNRNSELLPGIYFVTVHNNKTVKVLVK
jgi:hypothetical protein